MRSLLRCCSNVPRSLLAGLALCGALLGAVGCATEPTAGAGEPSPSSVGARPELNANFLSADLDVDEYVARFEGESREIAVARDGLVATLDLEPGMAVADIGAGTGLFLEPLASAVGPEGRLYAVDISPGFIAYLGERAQALGLSQVVTVQCDARSTRLPDASVDRVFICDTYHHFEHPLETMASVRRALRPGGELIVVDFERIPGVTREWLLDHVRAGKQVFRAEIESAGFALLEELKVDGLSENYVLRFRRP